MSISLTLDAVRSSFQSGRLTSENADVGMSETLTYISRLMYATLTLHSVSMVDTSNFRA